jgi:hypothetical protein
MKELQFKHIAGYLPYKLNITRNDDAVEIKHVNATKTLTFLTVEDTSMYGINGWKPALYGINGWKPALRPVSDLYKKIIHNGEEITPLLKLAHIVTDLEWRLLEDTSDENSDNVLTPPYATFGGEKHGNAVVITESKLHFWYQHGCFSIKSVSGDNPDDFRVCAPDHIELFDYLNELKIDYRGLIDAGLAIDANTLKENPYK